MINGPDIEHLIQCHQEAADADLRRLFAYEHLPPHLQEVSKPFAELASLVMALPRGFERSVALRKLLEAKDCAVRTLVKPRSP